MSDPLKEIKSGLHRIDSYLVEKYKHRCPEDVWTMFNGLYFRFNTHTGLRLQMSSDTTNEYWGIKSLNLGQLQTLAEALPIAVHGCKPPEPIRLKPGVFDTARLKK